MIVLLLQGFPAAADIGGTTASPPILRLGADHHGGPVPQAQLHILRDAGGTLSLDEVLAAERRPGGAGFTPLSGPFSKGYTRDAYWLRLEIARTLDAAADWWLVAWPPFVDDVRLYTPDASGAYTERRAGDHVPVADRALAVRETVFPLTLDVAPRTVYLRVASTSALTLSLQLWTPQAYTERSVFTNTRQGVFVGLLVTAIVVSLLSALWLRRWLFVIATAYLCVYGALHFALNGYDQLVLYPGAPWLADNVVGVLGTLTAAALIHFVLAYLEPGRAHRGLSLTLSGLAWLCLLWAVLSAFGLYAWIAPLFQIASLLILVLLIALMMMMLPHSRLRATLMLVMFLPSMLAVLVQVLRNLGVFPTNFWTTGLWELTTLFQIPFAAVVVLLRVREIEQQHQIAAAREQAQRGLVNMIAHELRTPLAVIDTAVANIEARTLAERPELLPRYRRIHTALARLNTLVDNALAEDRLQDGDVDIVRQPVAPSELAAQVRELLDVDTARHPLTVRLPDDDTPVQADTHWLCLAVLNLLDNAIKYSPGGGPIVLDMQRDPTALRISVEDRGIGIPPEARDRLFDRLFRADNARVLPGASGLGIGLYLVRQIARRHGGDVQVDSTPGAGSCFTLRIPSSGR